MHSVVHAFLCSPSLSLVKTICYPEVFSFSSPATDWGRTHEQLALKRYLSNEMAHHDSLSVSASGLVLNETWPFLGAPPDGIVNCSCCGKGLVEIKCPYKHHRSTITSAINDLQFCLALVDGKVALKRSHPYFYQVQTQLHVCKVDFCDFCVYLFHPDKADDFFIESIFPDSSSCDVCVQKSSLFLQEVLLLELVGKWYTSTSYRLIQQVPTSSAAASTATAAASAAAAIPPAAVRESSLVLPATSPASSVMHSSCADRQVCCKAGCSFSLLLRRCPCGHLFHHICAGDELGKHCFCCSSHVCDT